MYLELEYGDDLDKVAKCIEELIYQIKQKEVENRIDAKQERIFNAAMVYLILAHVAMTEAADAAS